MTFFSESIRLWYTSNKRNLPWRETQDPYRVWLSEIILQQTQVKQGLPYYKTFIEAYPSVFDLAAAAQDAVLKHWQGLGYYSRARNLHDAAKYIAETCQGVFPDNYNALLKLKGVGDYTASAIASICFNEPTAVVDGNVYRVLSRHFGIETPINSSAGAKQFKTLAQDLIDKKAPGEFNQAVMEFGAMHCKPQKPLCPTCPLQQKCMAFNTNTVARLPVKIKAAKPTKKHFNFLVILSKDQKTILEKRSQTGIWQNLYQFPLIETPRKSRLKHMEALAQELHILKDKSFEITLFNSTPIVHKLSHRHLHTSFWILKLQQTLGDDGVALDKIETYAVPVLLENFMRRFNFSKEVIG